MDGKDTVWSSGTAGTVVDKSGQGNTGTLTNMSRVTAQTIGKIGQGINFDGSNDYLRMSGFSKTVTSATFTSWVKLDSKDAGDGIIFTRDSVATGMNLGYPNAGATLGYHWNDDANTYNWTGGPTVPTGRWAFLAVVVTPSQATAYVYSSSGLNSAVNTNSHASVTIGDLYIGQDPNARLIDGVIDDSRIYNRALSATEVLQLYNQGR
jgi:hypothetical protein